ncbi:MAG: 2-dehydropantoate 2-reductase [Pseudomonadota bacterium]|nr:2-dehydropantoate 2-reductase [Pseudomonadota bacterium]
MRYLIVGAGALGGYFGGRLLDAGCDVTFLLRPGRAAALARTGLVIKSPRGDLRVAAPPFVLAESIASTFDVVVVGCKAYDLAETMASFAPAVGPDTAILPLLNGMRHLDALQQRFGAEPVLGGLCLISAALDAEGTVLHFNDLHGLVFGELDGRASTRIAAIERDFAGANFKGRSTPQILQEMWEKWVFIASAAGITSLMRANIGEIVASGGSSFALALYDECRAIAAANGFPPGPASIERGRSILTEAGSPFTASMLKDVERGSAVEADHVLGDLLGRAPATAPETLSLLGIAYAHLKAYEARRARIA